MWINFLDNPKKINFLIQKVISINRNKKYNNNNINLFNTNNNNTLSQSHAQSVKQTNRFTN